MASASLQRSRHLAFIMNINRFSSKSTSSARSICTVHPMGSSISGKTFPLTYNIDNHYLNCNLSTSLIKLYSTDRHDQQQRQQQQQPQSQQQQSTVNSDTDVTLLQPDKILMRYVDELIDFREKKPTRTWLTVIKVLITMFAGVNFGAFMARLGATLLEKYEIFVRDEDDSDD